MTLELADPLIEKAVRLALAGGRQEAVYHREREELYGVEDPDGRERAFLALHRDWFLALGLERPFREALAEVPAVEEGVARTSVTAAERAAQEGAELYVAEGGEAPPRERRSVVVRVLPETVVDAERLLWLLRRELLHVADMVDPAFGYEPRLPPSAAGPVHDDLLRVRYGALWSTSVLGRLDRRGHAPRGTKDAARKRFESAFSMIGPSAEELFQRLHGGERPTHGELVEIARQPQGAAGVISAGMQCPVCGFPSYVCETPDSLEAEVVATLRAEKPGWCPEQGLCPRCADLYRVRAGVFGRCSG